MTNTIVLIAAVHAASVLTLLVLAKRAPEAWQDDTGFYVVMPRLCQRDQQQPGHVHFEGDGSGLPARVINHSTHNDGVIL